MQQELHQDLWPYILTFLPDNIELHARNAGAFRRARGVKSAEQLLRMFLAYGTTNQSLRGISAWAESIGIASMSPTAFMDRLENSAEWLSQLIAEVVNDVIQAVPGINGYRLRIVDATVINGPGQGSVDWRVHAFIDPLTGRLALVELSDEHQGEGFALHPLQENDLVLGDRGYAYARSIVESVRDMADVIVRLNPGNIRICDQLKHVVNWSLLGRVVPITGPKEFDLLLPEPPPKGEKYKNWPLQKAQTWTPIELSVFEMLGENSFGY